LLFIELEIKSRGEKLYRFSPNYIRRHTQFLHPVTIMSETKARGPVNASENGVSPPKIRGPTVCRYPTGIGITLSMESHAACMPIERSCRGNELPRFFVEEEIRRERARGNHARPREARSQKTALSRGFLGVA